MTDVGFMASLDWIFELESEDGEPCMIEGCGKQAVMEAVVDELDCDHRQLLCLAHYEVEIPRWKSGDNCWCYHCVKTTENPGTFNRWERV